LEEQVRDAVASVTETFGKLNIAFNNAGVIMGGAKVGDVDTQRWEREIRINFFGAFYCAKYEILEMLKNGEPSSMVFTSSVGGLIGTPMGAAYCCAKAALIELAKVITCDYAARGIRANAICPGQIDTPMYRGLLRGSAGDNPEDVDDFIRRQNPQRRLGNPEEVAAAVAFLLSDEASHISGIALPVDGGHVATNLAYFLREYK
jgi:NAD(P)-dependent dehydrogenase (short-subunit alcohol dehydrogenase family)